MEDNEKLIEQFSSISGVDPERSRFYLESSAWNIETALSSYYEGENEDVAHEEAPIQVATKDNEEQPQDMPKISANYSDESSSEEEGQAFYAGGSEHSGQQVLGPPKKKDVVSMLFKSAKEHGAEVLEAGATKGKGEKVTFSGTGYRLGETEDDHEAVSMDKQQKQDLPRDVVLKMWKTGFTVDNGPLREYSDPSNHEFLSSVRRGQIPMELVRSARGGEVYINMEDHRHEDFVPAKSKMVAFSGAGHTLGSPAPSLVGEICDTKIESSSIDGPNEDLATHNLNVDPSQPITSIQLRLPDGSRLLVRLNHAHTVGHIREYALAARPNLPTDFALMTTFPHVELTDNSQSLVEAKLLNAALVIK